MIQYAHPIISDAAATTTTAAATVAENTPGNWNTHTHTHLLSIWHHL